MEILVCISIGASLFAAIAGFVLVVMVGKLAARLEKIERVGIVMQATPTSQPKSALTGSATDMPPLLQVPRRMSLSQTRAYLERAQFDPTREAGN